MRKARDSSTVAVGNEGRAVPSFSFGGVHISCVDEASAIDRFLDIAEARSGGYVASSCTHGIVESQSDPELLKILNQARMNLPDGMPTVWMGRHKGFEMGRVTAPDFLEAIMRSPRAKTLRHYFYGGSPSTLEQIASRAKALLGDEAVVGFYSPPFRRPGEAESAEVISAISAARPHIIWVGLGLPKQEYWMSRYSAAFPDSVMIGVGAAFDWFGGSQPRAPHTVQQLGLEWLFRLGKEPKRLWRRYLEVVPKALLIMLKESRTARNTGL